MNSPSFRLESPSLLAIKAPSSEVESEASGQTAPANKVWEPPGDPDGVGFCGLDAPTSKVLPGLRQRCRRWMGLVALALLLPASSMAPLAAQSVSDFMYSSNGTAITIHSYTGAGGVVTIPDTIAGLPVRTIGSNAFRDNTALTRVTIPESVSSIRQGPFRGCTSLLNIEVAAANTAFRSVSGVLFNMSQTTLIQYPGGITGSYTIPNSVTTIGKEAFLGCTRLTSVTIPDSVTFIGDYAFSGCAGLTGVTIPDSVTYLGDRAFSGCSNLLNFEVAAANTAFRSVDGVLFLFNMSHTMLIQYPEGKTGSYSIPNSVTSIAYRAFHECDGLTGVTIPDSVVGIGTSAFAACGNLLRIEVAAANTAFQSVDGVLFNINQTTLIQYPGGKTGSYTIPNSVTLIDFGAFSDCTGLTNVTIPDSVIPISSYAFSGCTALTSVTIPNSVTSIGHYTFMGCSSLTNVTIPDSVTFIGERAFSGCGSLMNIEVASANAEFRSVDGVLFNMSQTTLIQYPGGKTGSYTIPNSVTTIGNDAFLSCTGLTSVTIPDSVTSLRSHAFTDCMGLTSVTIPDSVTTIGDYAFLGCAGLDSVFIPDSVIFIGGWAFSGCQGLTKTTFEGNAPSAFGFAVFNNTAPDFTVYYFEDSTGFTSPTWHGYPAVALPRPPDAGSELQVILFTRQGGAVSLVAVGGRQGWTYELQRSADFGATPWATVATLGPLTAAGPIEINDSFTSASQAFYRILGRSL